MHIYPSYSLRFPVLYCFDHLSTASELLDLLSILIHAIFSGLTLRAQF